MNEARYTGTYHADGTTDCSAELFDCQYEQDIPCWHCSTPIREHHDEDGTTIKVDVRGALAPTT